MVKGYLIYTLVLLFMRELVCKRCGGGFSAVRLDAVFCSDTCRQSYNRGGRLGVVKPARVNKTPVRVPRVGFVYVVHVTGTDVYKIGVSNNPGKRLKEVSYTTFHELILFMQIRSKDCMKLESKLLKKFRDKRIKGEWVRLNESDILYLKSLKYEGKEGK